MWGNNLDIVTGNGLCIIYHSIARHLLGPKSCNQGVATVKPGYKGNGYKGNLLVRVLL